ncbi:MAG: transposase [Verrucomicrobiia bacterium]
MPHREGHARDFIRRRVINGTTINADEAGSWDKLNDRFEVHLINNEEACGNDGACTNWAEEFFSHMRRAEIGHHHHIASA